MIKKSEYRNLFLTIVCLLTLFSISAAEQKKAKRSTRESAKAVPTQTPTIWHDPGAIEKLDFVNGPGGARLAPKPPFTFLEEDTAGTNPKVKVKDAAGQTWGVKWGSEIHSEVFASRMAWAAGYYVEPNYFIKSGRILGVTGLKRAKKYVSSDGSFVNARFELKEKGISKQTDKESWRWDKNPFVGTRELNGLRVMVMLTSNWDPKDQRDESSNTAIYTRKKTGEVIYVLSDWGATMGKWGGFFSREKWDCEGYSRQGRKLVTGVEGGIVQFGYDGKLASEIRTGIKAADVRWLLGYLGRITDSQIRAGLESCGATSEETKCFTESLRERINQLANVSRL